MSANWQDRDLCDLLKEYPLLAGCSQNLLLRYQIPVEAGLMIACAAMTAAAGPCFRLRAPFASEIQPSLHLLLVSNRPMAVYFGTQEVFNSVLKMVRSLVAENEKAAEDHAADLQRHAIGRKNQVIALQKQKERYRAAILDRCGIDLEVEPDVALLFGAEYHQYEEASFAARAEAKNSAGLAEFIRRPGSLVEAIYPSEWLVPEAYACDHAMFNLDSGGSTWAEFTGESESIRRKIAHKLLAGLEGAPFRYGGKTAPPWHLSSLSVVGVDIFDRLVTDEEVCKSGLAGHLIAVETNLDESRAREIESGTDNLEFAGLLASLQDIRIGCDAPVIWSLSPEAEEDYLRFLNKLAHDSAVGERRRSVDMLPTFVLKMAVWLRLGSPGGIHRTDPFDSEEMCSAMAVALRVHRKGPVLRPSAKEGQWIGHDDQVLANMVRKIQEKGPMTHRTLYRSFHEQRREHLRPVLKRGIAAGLILDREGSLMVPEGLLAGTGALAAATALAAG